MNADVAVLQLLRNHQFDQALTAAVHETELHPENSAAWTLLGETYRLQGRYDDAIASLTKATNLTPKSAPAWLSLGQCLLAENKFDEAANAYSKSIEGESEVPDTWKGLAICYIARHDLSGGRTRIGDLIQAHPDSVYGLCTLGDLQMQDGMLSTAILTLQKATDLKADYSRAWNLLGTAYGRSNQFEKALDCFNRTVQLQPGWDDALNNLGYTYFVLGQTDKAIETYKEALQANPNHASTLFNLTTAYAREKKMGLAQATCETLAKIDPQDAALLAQHNFQVPSAPTPAPASNTTPSP